MEYISGLQSFLAEYEQYEKQVLKPTYDEILKLLNSWENPEYWEKYTVNKGVATPSPIRMTLVRIKPRKK